MSTSNRRRTRRELERLEKMPNWKVVQKYKNLVPNNIKLKSDMVKGDQTYEEFIKNVELTPEILKEIEEYDTKNNLSNQKSVFNIYNK
jgi:hypothetical protein